MTSVSPRLREIVRDLKSGRAEPTKQLALEAAREIAADGNITAAEVDLLEPFGDGVDNFQRRQLHDSGYEQRGTEVGRALFNGLSDAIEAALDKAKRDKPASEFNPFNPFTWLPLPVTSAPTSEAQVLDRTWNAASSWISSSVKDLLAQYPKAVAIERTTSVKYKPEVEAAIQKLFQDWKTGNIPDGDVAGTLKPLLDAKYSNSI